MKKRGKLFRERASAMLFSLPGKCDRRMVKLCWAATRNRVRSSRMRSGCFAALSCPCLDNGEIVAMEVDA